MLVAVTNYADKIAVIPQPPGFIIFMMCPGLQTGSLSYLQEKLAQLAVGRGEEGREGVTVLDRVFVLWMVLSKCFTVLDS